ncbi:MAG: endonuclease III, partial [Planctomycetes bacterium]|nr:endonuclease III [Planctomycetota bacterium]
MKRTGESTADRKKRARRILTALRKLYPSADCALRHDNPFQLLISTILSAQSTDETVNKVTPILFKRFKTPKALATAAREDVEAIIHST